MMRASELYQIAKDWREISKLRARIDSKVLEEAKRGSMQIKLTCPWEISDESLNTLMEEYRSCGFFIEVESREAIKHMTCDQYWDRYITISWDQGGQE